VSKKYGKINQRTSVLISVGAYSSAGIGFSNIDTIQRTVNVGFNAGKEFFCG
jgi:hypothetical protein